MTAGSVVVGFDPIKRVWATRTRSVIGLVDLPPLDGKLFIDEASCAAVSDDFGHIIRQKPLAVLRPGSIDDIAAMVRFCNFHQIKVATRGQGHATYGQAQAKNGLVVDMSPLDTVHHIGGDYAVVDAGTRWSSLLKATLARGLTPPVLTDYLELSVGGTLSVGGIGGASGQYGAQTDNVLELEVITGEGRLETCSHTRGRRLFEATLGGLGQCALIVRATVGLIQAPTNVRTYQLYYHDLRTFTADQRRVLTEGRFDYLEGQAYPDPNGGWRLLLEAAAFFTPPSVPDDTALLDDLRYERGSQEITDLSYYDFLDRLAPSVAYLKSTGEWYYPHPWWNVFLPDSATDSYLDGVLERLGPEDIGASGVVLVYPIRRDRLKMPLLRVPDEPVIFLFALLRTAQPEPRAVASMIADNRMLYDRACALGAMAYPIGTIPFTRQDWSAHFGTTWTMLSEAKRSCDPHNLLTPGQNIFGLAN
jgi:cytokinin dehydrogenase